MGNFLSDLADGIKKLQKLDKDMSQVELREKILDTRQLLLDVREELMQRDETIAELQKQIKTLSSGQACVVCKEGTMEVVDSRPHPTFGDLGKLEHTLKCSNCGRIEKLMFDPGKRSYI